jgi:hypothetical protein
MVSNARTIQVCACNIYVNILITSLIQMIKDIPNEEFDHKTLGCNRWEILWK